MVIFVIIVTTSINTSSSLGNDPNIWNFGDVSLEFADQTNFETVPSQGVFPDDGVVNYWGLNEENGSVIYDSEKNYSIINGATRVNGKLGHALSFDGVNDYVDILNVNMLNVTNALTIDLWINIQSSLNGSQWLGIIGKNPGWAPTYALGGAYGYIYFGITTKDGTAFAYVPQGELNVWQHLSVTYNNDAQLNNLRIYRNGLLEKSITHTGSILSTKGPLLLGKGSVSYFNGIIDEIFITNRALSDQEIKEFHSMGNPMIFDSYYSFTDSQTKNKMLIDLKNNSPDDSFALIECTDFFTNDRLVFKANSSSVLNIWTNLGQPVFTTGVWNSQNFTTTLLLDSSSAGEIRWPSDNHITTYSDAHSNVSPFNITLKYNTSQTFTFNASKGYTFNVLIDNVSMGQISNYTFTNVTELHTISVISSKLTCAITVLVDDHSIISPKNVTVQYGENQLFTISADSNYQISHVYIDGVDQGKLPSYNFTNVQTNHTISLISEIINSSLTPTTNPDASTSPTPTSTVLNSFFTIEIMVILPVVLTLLIAFIGFATKKRYIKIEIIEDTD